MLDLTPSTFEDFELEAQCGNVVPVVRSVLADLQTTVGAFLRIAGDAPYAFLLESIEGGERVARYSFLGANPWMVARGRGAETIVEKNGNREVHQQNAVEFLREYFAGKNLARRPGLAPLAGGAVGYLAYDAARWFEPVLDLNGNAQSSEASDAVWMFFRNIVAFDRVRQQMEITSVVFTDEAEGDRDRLRQLYERALAETARIESELSRESMPAPSLRRNDGDQKLEFQSNWPRKDFEAAVDTVKNHIVAGDCYQAVIAQQFTKPIAADPISIYRALRATNPSPYMYFLRLGAETIVGASPELLVRCHDRWLDYRPIAGTRKRGATEAEDLRLGEEMRRDEKEVAEHTMLVDLGRNDLGRVSVYGSVKVDELMTVERYSHVQHLVTSLRSRLRDELDRFDALAACFPAGTVTGAPKIRAMEIIRELEPAPRGVYAGAVLYVDYADNLDSCIAIRTMSLRNGMATVQAGAGIVADSVPEREYEECLNKARALFRAVELAERGL
ncbi:MAG TPA: anthranilate synthase component I family protein [Pyrinomonadaceae bacterium]|nr:anthranilate synthase component I family protein [Pyrinomonadaceae bacterium]